MNRYRLAIGLSLMTLMLFASGLTASETNSGSMYSDPEAWYEAVPRRLRDHAAFEFVSPRDSLPKVLIIGDSISISYTAAVREKLDGLALVFRVPENSRSTAHSVKLINYNLGDVEWDLIVFNWGVHDITHMDSQGVPTPPPSGTRQVPIGIYEANLRALVRAMASTGADMLWISTTPIGKAAGDFRRDSDVVRYNQVASRVMAQSGIRVLDLYSLLEADANELQTDGVHFSRIGRQRIAFIVADAISELLGLRND